MNIHSIREQAQPPSILSAVGLTALLLLWTSATGLGGVPHAQATPPITPSGLNTQVNLSATPPAGMVQYDITGGTRAGGGVNLFHSFGEFNVPTNNIANFLNDSGLATSNILGRVTGGNPSTILGTIQTTAFGNANLFLMNPTGFLFGPNATVNVGGMVAFTTADYLRLQGIGGNGVFYADSAQASVLTNAPVAAFGFLGSNPGAITVQGSRLSVSPGQSISLVGGHNTIQAGTLDDGTTVQPARLSAPGGKINLASVASAGEVLYPSLQSGLNINVQSFTNMGAINLSGGSTLDVSSDAAAAGTVRIRGGQFVMDQATISANTVNANGAQVAIDLNVIGDVSISTVDVSALTARTTGSGDAGNIRISSNNMDVTATTLNNFIISVIDTHTSGSGKAGAVSITATNNLTLTVDPSAFVFAIDSGTIGPDGGHGANVTLTAKNIDMQHANINTGDFVALNVGEEAAGSGGNLTITADSLHLTNSFLATDSFSAQGGDLTISARDVQINEFSGLETTGFKKAGAIRITADQLIVDSSQLEVDNGFGPSGGITISGKVVELKNGSTIASQTFADQAGGDITITTTDHLTLSDDPTTLGALVRPTGLFTNPPLSPLSGAGHGNAGAIVINTPRLEISGGARIDTTTHDSSPAGPVTIRADTISISGTRSAQIIESQFGTGGQSSGIYSRTLGSELCTGPCGDGGSISITARSLDLNQGAQIDSTTTSTGKGGNINVITGQSVMFNNGASHFGQQHRSRQHRQHSDRCRQPVRNDE